MGRSESVATSGALFRSSVADAEVENEAGAGAAGAGKRMRVWACWSCLLGRLRDTPKHDVLARGYLADATRMDRGSMVSGALHCLTNCWLLLRLLLVACPAAALACFAGEVCKLARGARAAVWTKNPESGDPKPKVEKARGRARGGLYHIGSVQLRPGCMIVRIGRPPKTESDFTEYLGSLLQ